MAIAKMFISENVSRAVSSLDVTLGRLKFTHFSKATWTTYNKAGCSVCIVRN
jgi:hypothetical protein